MIDEKTIHRMEHDGYDSVTLRRWVDQLLAERELLVAEHETVSAMDAQPNNSIRYEAYWRARRAVEDFDVASVPRRSSIVAIGT